jgi:hypothetical protein
MRTFHALIAPTNAAVTFILLGSPEARTNVENFIAWSRGLGLYDPDIFEVDDLAKVRRVASTYPNITYYFHLQFKNQRNVIFG